MRNWRPLTWIILVVNILFLIWVISGIATGGQGGEDCIREARTNQFLDRKDCETAGQLGTAVGVGLIIVLWALVDVILGVLWLVTRSSRRTCPVCGTSAKKGVTVCHNCGHDFRAGVTPNPLPQQPRANPSQPSTTRDEPPFYPPPPPGWKPSGGTNE